ncbi:radical SAM protein [Desulfofustis glycolicus]|uniref:Radical SAM additional 4Fe4S-binding SPASM domain-containing protein n=1 Tax=Desulfofustis glycolicus DSM 9705 TaxID=1121409 RepID=A0A1M5YNI6_9BACT|nr:radical SAM protein [Desulfofustis glycolicus]SHI13501.1 radical SAM additional 4Fe4S-binding SPASM domain-containing protein [Desulfofustis glycolicus DSM 9705]
MTEVVDIKNFQLWERMTEKLIPFGFDIDVTARCNFNCRHCYINLSPGDLVAQEKEMSFREIVDIAGQAVELGALWCVLTGGEPLLRPDFADLYLALKRLGLMVSVYSNASLIQEEHIALFQKYPPRDLEVTVYGTTAKTFERITRRPGSFAAFTGGLQRLLSGGVKVRLKAMALRSNLHEMNHIANFCRKHTKDYYRFDPLLHLRLDRNQKRNKDIIDERLAPSEIAAMERSDPERSMVLDKHCEHFIQLEGDVLPYEACQTCETREQCDRYTQFSRLLYCGAGLSGFSISWDGQFRLCQSLNAPGTTYDLRRGTLHDAWRQFVPKVRALGVHSSEYLSNCKSCTIVNLCLNCPAHAWLESGDCEAVVPYFCNVAHVRKESLEKNRPR